MKTITGASAKVWIFTWLLCFNALTIAVALDRNDDFSFIFSVWLFGGIASFFLTIPAFLLLIITNHLCKKYRTDFGSYLTIQLILVVAYLLPFTFLFHEICKSLTVLPFLAAIAGNLYANLSMYFSGVHPVIQKNSSFIQFNNMETNPNQAFSQADQPAEATSKNYGFKLLILGAMALLLFLGTLLVRSLIHERQAYRDTAVAFFEQSWGREQTISGPYLSIPYQVKVKDGGTAIYYAYLMPKNLKLDCNAETEQRRKGIYDVQLYKAHQAFSGSFDLSELNNSHLPSANLLWDRASICFGFSDAAAFEQLENLSVNNQKLELEPGLPTDDVFKSGFSANISLANMSTLEFEAKMSIRGTEKISFVPVGKETEIRIRSNWPSPDFFGLSIPVSKPETGNKGFTGTWKIQHLNRSFPQTWSNQQTKYDITQDVVGVRLINPVDHYVQSERIVKYALLVIGLVFTIFFFIEILNGRQIHPLQYLLVGFALCLFYSLMVSLSEHIAFLAAYWTAAGMTILLISVYLKSVLGQLRLALFSGISLTAIYGFMYMLLLQEDYALLMGNIGLFIVLALVMYFSRKVKWGGV